MFLKKYLNITDVKARFIKDKVTLLEDIIRSYVVRFPFQNISSFGAIKPTEKGWPVPGLKEILSANYQGVGGLCCHNNYFMKLLLDSIGYETQTISASNRKVGIPSHFVTLVRIGSPYSKNRKDEKLYFVDVGFGIPLHEPILLDKLPYRSRAGGLNYRYEKTNVNSLQRINENGDPIVGEKPSTFLSPQDCFIDLLPKTFQDILPALTEVYTKINIMPLHRAPYCFRYLSITDSDFEIVCIRDTELIFITKETRKVHNFKNYFDLRPSFTKYFPMIDSSEVNLALENYTSMIRA